MVASTTVSEPSDAASAVAASPSLRIFAARLAYQMNRAVNPEPGLEMDVLLSYLEGFAKDAAPEVAESLAQGVELAMRCGGLR